MAMDEHLTESEITGAASEGATDRVRRRLPALFGAIVMFGAGIGVGALVWSGSSPAATAGHCSTPAAGSPSSSASDVAFDRPARSAQSVVQQVAVANAQAIAAIEVLKPIAAGGTTASSIAQADLQGIAADAAPQHLSCHGPQ